MTYYEIIGLIAAIAGIISFGWFFYEKKFPWKKVSWKRVERGAERICREMVIKNDFKPSLIFGIGRGGSIFGSIISGCLGHCPQLVVDRKYTWSDKGRMEDLIFRVNIPEKYLPNVLLVAGEAHSGRTMNLYYDYFKNMKAGQIKRAVFLFEKGCPTLIEFKGMKTTRKDLLLPWMFSKNYIRSDMQCGPKDECETRIILHIIRHAETSPGDGMFVGRTDYPLSIRGIEQALDVGRFLSSKKIARIYSSPTERAIKTATILHHFVPDADLTIDESLREMDFGEWDGLPRKEIAKRYFHAYEKWKENPSQNIPENAESPEIVGERLHQFLKKVEKVHYQSTRGSEIIAVSHKTAIRILLSKIELLRLRDYRKIKAPSGSVHTLTFSGNKWEFSGKLNYDGEAI